MQGLKLARQVLYHLRHAPSPVLFYEITQASLELALYPKLAWNSSSSCLILPSARITGMYHLARIYCNFSKVNVFS
jgi:hypothetical protein